MPSRRRFISSTRAGFVPAGGRSSRMGQDKALPPWKGSTLIQSVAHEAFDAAGNVTLIGSPERYGNLGLTVISDRIPGSGPLGGLHAALSATTAEWDLPVACGIPAVESAIHSKLLKMHDFVSTISAPLWPAPDPAVFSNINAPEQLLGAR